MNFEEKVYLFLDDLNQFQYKYEFSDRVWDIIFKHKKTKWHKMSVRYDQGIYYIALLDKNETPIEVKHKESVNARNLRNEWLRSPFGYNKEEEIDMEKIWEPYITSAHLWIAQVKKNWIKTSTFVTKNYPLNFRTGYVSHALVRSCVPDIYRLDLELGSKNVNKFIKIVDSHYLRDSSKTICSKMTAKQYFEYCKIAYMGVQDKNNRIDKKLSGKELYKIYADGRDEGLLDIDLDSEDEFASWLGGTHPKKETGGHPWEIMRGGNTTHIDLSVRRPEYFDKKDFIVTVSARAVSRLAEAIRMFLAIYDAGLPIKISGSDEILRRILAQDNIGIVPKYESLHRANQDFPENQDVHDVMHYDDLGKFKRRIKSFIVWEALPLLVPNKVEKIYGS